MSKKLAEGLDALVLDVKTGNGAFMEKLDDSIRLAEAMVQTGNSCGVKTNALISDMSQPLGKFVGNVLEVYECLEIMRGQTDEMMNSTLDLSIELTARMLYLTKLADSIDSAKSLCVEKINSGEALEKFRQNIELQGGNPAFCDAPTKLLEKVRQIPLTAKRPGFITEVDTKTVGNAICEIGGGRTKIDDRIDFAVGYQCLKRIGDEVNEGEPVGILHYRQQAQVDLICEKLRSAYQISDEKPENIGLIRFVVK
jgi:pyrimidine-nucleoside phosphorylase